MAKLSYWLNNPECILEGLALHGLVNWIPDSLYLKMLFRARTGKRLNLKNPRTFNEKLQWLKLYNRNDYYTKLADKYLVREVVSEVLGDQLLIPLLGVYNCFDEIDFEKLPERFVIKCNHDSGGVMVVKDKRKLNIKAAKAFFDKCMRRNFYYAGREWQYKNIERKIIIEEYLENLSGDLTDYKFVTINGKVEWIFVCTDRFKGGARNSTVKFTNFDSKWNRMPFEYIYPSDSREILPPKNLNTMIKYAEKMAKDIPQVRIDFYEVESQIYFGEVTFFTEGGMGKFTPDEWNEKLGVKLELSNNKQGLSK